jgi:hypothetical protein
MADNVEEEDLDLITVGKRRDDNKAVWDRDPRHPSNYGGPAGEVFISDMRPYQVIRTPGIQQKIGEQELMELSDRRAQTRLSEHEERTRVADEQRAALREQMSPNAVTIAPAQAVTATGNGGTPVAVPVVSAPPPTAGPESGASGVMDPQVQQQGEAGQESDGGDGEEAPADTTGTQSSGATIARPRARRGGEAPPER